MAPHSSTLAWKIPWTEEPGGPQPMGSLGVRQDWQLHFHFSLSCIGEGNGNPLQCSCLESPRDGEASWAAFYGVAQSRTWLKRLSSSSSSSRDLAAAAAGSQFIEVPSHVHTHASKQMCQIQEQGKGQQEELSQPFLFLKGAGPRSSTMQVGTAVLGSHCTERVSAALSIARACT